MLAQLGSTLSPPSLADPHHGRVTKKLDPQVRGTATVMLQCAFVQEAGSTQRQTGELLKQQCTDLNCLPTGSGIKNNKGSAMGTAIPWLQQFVLTTSISFAPPDPGNCGCAAPVLLRVPTDTAPLWGTAPAPGNATPVLARTLVGTKAFGAMQWGQGPGWAWQQGL